MNISYKKNSLPQSIWKNPLEFVACGFGVGAMPWMPGTFGTGIGVIFYLVLSHFSLITYCIVTVLFFIFGIFASDIVNRRFGTVDHPGIVWDEIVGFLVVMMGVRKSGDAILLGFILFRLFDIWKPWPINWLDKTIKNGFGVMIDDIVAALYAWIFLATIFGVASLLL